MLLEPTILGRVNTNVLKWIFLAKVNVAALRQIGLSHLPDTWVTPHEQFGD